MKVLEDQIISIGELFWIGRKRKCLTSLGGREKVLKQDGDKKSLQKKGIQNPYKMMNTTINHQLYVDSVDQPNGYQIRLRHGIKLNKEFNKVLSE